MSLLVGQTAVRNAPPVIADLMAQSIAANTASSDGNTLTANANGVMAAIGGVSPAVGMVILYMPGSARDGFYVVTSVGSVSAPFVLDRLDGFRSGQSITGGVLAAVGRGTNGIGTLHLVYNDAGFSTAAVLNTSTLTLYTLVQQSPGALYTDTSGTPGSATANTASGRSAIALGASAATITSDQCFTTSVVLAQLEDLDATLTRIKVVPGNGSFVVTGDATATAATKFRWVIVNTPT